MLRLIHRNLPVEVMILLQTISEDNKCHTTTMMSIIVYGTLK
jgi:hypothetical protein